MAQDTTWESEKINEPRQSDQSHCLSLEYSMSAKLLAEHHLQFLALKGGCTGSFESTLIKMPHCRKSHVAAQINTTSQTNLPVCSLVTSCLSA